MAVDIDDLPVRTMRVSYAADGTLVPIDIPGDGRFMVAPRLKTNISPGLAIGEAEIAAEGDIPTANIHGVKIGLRRADKPSKPRRTTGAPRRNPSWPGRKYGPHDLMAFCAGRGLIPTFMSGINV